MGIDIWQRNIPVLDEVSGACELLGLDPLYVANEGVFIAVVESEVADQVVDKLRQFDYCTNASIIGEVVTQHPKKVILTSRIGGKRVVNMLVGEQLPRIC
jgi:hydrogenase expression/formation protein HypE